MENLSLILITFKPFEYKPKGVPVANLNFGNS
jgi:hypothetical protein